MEQRETILSITGMSCNSCARHVSQALGAVAGVEQAEVKLGEEKAWVRHSPAVTVDALIAAVTETGYEARAVSTGSAP